MNSDECKHHVRNGIGGIKAERHKILKFLLQAEEAKKDGNPSKMTVSLRGIIRAIRRLDEHILRIEETVKKCEG